MKKFLIAFASAALLIGAMSSCEKTPTEKEDSYKALGDSLALLNGKMYGYRLNELMADSTFAAEFNEQQFLKGLKATLFADTTSNSYLMGADLGMALISEIMNYERTSDIRIDRQALYDALVEVIRTDSVGNPMEIQMEYQNLMLQAREAQAEYHKAQVLAREDVKNTMRTGEFYINDAKKADPSIKTTKSGLAYKVIEEGEGEPITENDRVSVNYVGKHTDGTEFDNSNGTPRTFSPKSVVPGFGEGLQLMKKGAKYILYIPGDLGYGVDGQPHAGILPMETLVFEVEVVDVNRPSTPMPNPGLQIVPSQPMQ